MRAGLVLAALAVVLLAAAVPSRAQFKFNFGGDSFFGGGMEEPEETDKAPEVPKGACW